MNNTFKRIFQNNSNYDKYSYKFIRDNMSQTEGRAWNDEYIRLTNNMEENDKNAMYLYSPLEMRANMISIVYCYYLYIIYDNRMIVGCIICTDESSKQDINYVSIHPAHRNKGLCKKMLSFFIEELLKIRKVKKFTLVNIGHVSACMCYVPTFDKYGYKVQEVELSSNRVKNTCAEYNLKWPHMYPMTFIKENTGGVRIRTLKNKKYKKSRNRTSHFKKNVV